MNYKQLNKISIREGFEKFNKENPHIYQAFEVKALSLISRTNGKISSKHIINELRWEVPVTSNDINFKINDAFQSYYSRLFIENHPEHAGRFILRKQRNEEESPYMGVGEGGQLFFY